MPSQEFEYFALLSFFNTLRVLSSFAWQKGEETVCMLPWACINLQECTYINFNFFFPLFSTIHLVMVFYLFLLLVFNFDISQNILRVLRQAQRREGNTGVVGAAGCSHSCEGPCPSKMASHGETGALAGMDSEFGPIPSSFLSTQPVHMTYEVQDYARKEARHMPYIKINYLCSYFNPFFHHLWICLFIYAVTPFSSCLFFPCFSF